jgi:hypothetical protein
MKGLTMMNKYRDREGHDENDDERMGGLERGMIRGVNLSGDGKGND